MIAKNSLPYPGKFAHAIIVVIGIVTIMVFGRGIIVPLVFSLVISMVLNPVVEFLIRFRIPRIVSISLALLFVLLLVITIVVILYKQIGILGNTIPKITLKYHEFFSKLEIWSFKYLNISGLELRKHISNGATKLFNNSGSFVGATIMSTGGILVFLVLIPVYVFMILIYKKHLLNFLFQLFESKRKPEIVIIITEIKSVIQSYLFGLVIEAILMCILNLSALLILGIEFAFLIAVFGALINIIPYLGGIVSTTIPIIVAFVGHSVNLAIIVFVVFMIIQFIDNNYILPKIVASKVKLNALISMIVVIMGGAIWGISGMFLAIPITGIIKVILDHIPNLKPYGYILGELD